MLNNVLPLVTTLYIEKASQLRLGIVSNHLRDVHSVTICNLFQKNSESNRIQVNDDIATNSVFFLSRFPYLERVTFLGKDGNGLYHPIRSIINEDQRGSVHHLLDSFSAAFDCRHIPQKLQIIGLCCPKNGLTRNCKTCNKICRKFPFDSILDVDLCILYTSMKETIESRQGGKDYLQSESRFFMQLLSKGKGRVYQASSGLCCIIQYPIWVINYMKGFAESSNVDVTKLNPDDVVKAITRHYPNNITVYLSEQSFDHLKTTVGLPISNDLMNPNATRVENLYRMVKHIMEETDVLRDKSLG